MEFSQNIILIFLSFFVKVMTDRVPVKGNCVDSGIISLVAESLS